MRWWLYQSSLGMPRCTKARYERALGQKPCWTSLALIIQSPELHGRLLYVDGASEWICIRKENAREVANTQWGFFILIKTF